MNMIVNFQHIVEVPGLDRFLISELVIMIESTELDMKSYISCILNFYSKNFSRL